MAQLQMAQVPMAQGRSGLARGLSRRCHIRAEFKWLVCLLTTTCRDYHRGAEHRHDN
jgi:hypothetical protein